jgi:serine/threonine-protein kinase
LQKNPVVIKIQVMIDLNETGICINCGAEGPIGEYCTTPKCKKDDYGYTPGEIERDDIYLGRRIDDFLLIGTVGKGGFGKVYHALQMPVGMDVALKFLTGEADDGMRERFFREAQSLAMLKHPNIVRLNKFGDYRGKPYIAMELVDSARGLDKEIRDRVRQHKVFSRQEAKHILQQILNALGEAHSLNVIHRDIKPGNIKVSETGEVKLLDFGLAFQRSDDFDSKTIGGTPGYLSPELLLNRGADPRSDLYSLGICFFEVICGVHPYPHRDDWQSLVRMQSILSSPSKTD